MATAIGFGVMRAARVTVATAIIEETVVDWYPRCSNPRCGKPLAQYLARPWSIRCKQTGCNQDNHSIPKSLADYKGG